MFLWIIARILRIFFSSNQIRSEFFNSLSRDLSLFALSRNLQSFIKPANLYANIYILFDMMGKSFISTIYWLSTTLEATAGLQSRHNILYV